MFRPHLIRKLSWFTRDVRGMAAVEFAIILPMMLTIFFGTIEVSNGVTVDRKVTLAARTLSDLISQGTTATDTDVSNAFKMGAAIMTPYAATPLKQRVTAIWIDDTGIAKVVWSAGSNMAPLGAGETVSVPAELVANSTELIMSEISYTYTPAVGFVMTSGVTLSDSTYTRPRQSIKVERVTS